MVEQFVNAVPGRQIPSWQEIIRKTHIDHEGSVRSIGIIYCLNAVLLVILSIPSFVLPGQHPLFIRLLACLIIISVGVFQFFVGHGLQTLRKWARMPTIIFSCIGLLAFPLGTLVSAYFLYLVVCQKGKMVFSDEYKSVIKATPYFWHKISIVAWIFLGLLGLLVVLLIIAQILPIVIRYCLLK